MYFFCISVLDVDIDLEAKFLEVFVLVIAAKHCNFGGFSKSGWKVGRASDDLIAIFGVDVQPYADLY